MSFFKIRLDWDLLDAGIICISRNASCRSLNLYSKARWGRERIRLDLIDNENIFNIFSWMNASI